MEGFTLIFITFDPFIKFLFIESKIAANLNFLMQVPPFLYPFIVNTILRTFFKWCLFYKPTHFIGKRSQHLIFTVQYLGQIV